MESCFSSELQNTVGQCNNLGKPLKLCELSDYSNRTYTDVVNTLIEQSISQENKTSSGTKKHNRFELGVDYKCDCFDMQCLDVPVHGELLTISCEFLFFYNVLKIWFVTASSKQCTTYTDCSSTVVLLCVCVCMCM